MIHTCKGNSVDPHPLALLDLHGLPKSKYLVSYCFQNCLYKVSAQ